MKTKTLRIISIFIIMVIAIGCVNKSQEIGTNSVTNNVTNNGTNISENQDIDKPIMITETDNNETVFNDTNTEPKDTPEDVPIDPPADNMSTSTVTPTQIATSIATTQATPIATTQATPMATTQSDNNSSSPSSSHADNISVQNSSGLNDTSVTQTFKIGDEKNILGINIKLVNITDYNENTVILDIDGIEYKYDSEANIQVKGRKIIDVITSEDDQTADIAVDYS